jgi:hypothetical protein
MRSSKRVQYNCLKRSNWVELYVFTLNLTEGELSEAPGYVSRFFNDLPSEHLEKVFISDEVIDLANRYIVEKVVGRTSFDDCVQIALATIHRADILVSWNFRHIVNVYRIEGIIL